MFDNLTNRLSCTLRNINRHRYLNEDNIKKTLNEIRTVLLEADVALPVVRDFLNHIKEKAIGHEINKKLTPSQEFIKVVRDELVFLMGEENQSLNLATRVPAVILVVGLQGVGKTTVIGKLGNFLREKKKKKVLLVSVDVYRPAGIKQLEMLAKKANVDFFSSDIYQKPINIALSALKEAELKFYDVLLVDTAGRFHINNMMMSEVKQISDLVNPIETLFVIDAMIGQDAINVAKIFNEELPITGVILTKIDGDARGGAALSVRYITGKPIKFLSFGEKIHSIDPFYPKRIVSRILSMDDVISLIESIEDHVDHKKIENIAIKLKKGNNFDFTDFLEQLNQIKNLGGMSSLMDKLPGISKTFNNVKTQIDDRVLIRMEAIINSMTPKERAHPDIIKGSRKRRIAEGCGMHIQDVNRLLKQFNDMQRMIGKMKKTGIMKTIRSIKEIMPFKFYRH